MRGCVRTAAYSLGTGTEDDLVVSYRLLCGEVYRRKELHISYQQDDRDTVVLVRRDVTESYEEEQRQQERLMSALFDARHANQEKNEFWSA